MSTIRNLLTFITFIAANFFGRFIGSEGTAIMTTPSSVVLYGILNFSLLLLFRIYYYHLNNRLGYRVVFLIYLSLLSLTYLFCSSIRIFLSGLILTALLSAAGGELSMMMAPPGGEGYSGAGSSQRPVLDLNLPPGGRDELSDLVAKLDQVEREIRHLSESRIESPEEGEARQLSLSGLHTVLDEVENLLEQSRQLDGSRDQERAFLQRAELREPFRLYEEAEALLDARRQALAEASLSLQLQLRAQDQFLQEGQEGGVV